MNCGGGDPEHGGARPRSPGSGRGWPASSRRAPAGRRSRRRTRAGGRSGRAPSDRCSSGKWANLRSSTSGAPFEPIASSGRRPAGAAGVLGDRRVALGGAHLVERLDAAGSADRSRPGAPRGSRAPAPGGRPRRSRAAARRPARAEYSPNSAVVHRQPLEQLGVVDRRLEARHAAILGSRPLSSASGRGR